jgi:putative hydrolase of the HAD superfamily
MTDASDGPVLRAVVLDFGGPVLRTPFELLRVGERAVGLTAGTLDWNGPFDPASDADWQLMQSGGITERDYWQRKADRFAELTGRDATFQGLMDVLFSADEADLVRPEAAALVSDARAAGIAVAVCTNDMQAFHGEAWVARMSILRDLDALVDGSVEHVLKPDPRIYGMVLDRLELPASSCLFVDDQPGNIEGARAVGMATEWFDVTAPEASWFGVRRRLGLPD